MIIKDVLKRPFNPNFVIKDYLMTFMARRLDKFKWMVKQIQTYLAIAMN